MDATVIWDDGPGGNVEHIKEHGLTPDEVDEVLLDDAIPTAYSASTERPCKFGYTSTGKHIIVVWDEVNDDPRDDLPSNFLRGPGTRLNVFKTDSQDWKAFMATKKTVALSADVIAAARKRAAQTRRQLAHKPGPLELLTPQELADAAPYYLVLRDYIGQLKEAREAAGVTLAQLSARTNLAVETLSRLETGALTNPTWKTLGSYAAALGLRPRLVLEAIARNGGRLAAPSSSRAPG